MFQRDEFAAWMQRSGYSPNTCNTHLSYVRRIDALANGLDEKIASDGIEKVLEWARTNTAAPFDAYPNNSRSALRRYMEFKVATSSGDESDEEEGIEPTPNADRLVFRLESEMQNAVRRQLSLLEAGLKQIDGGSEATVSTGRMDILAEDAKGCLVVVELKAGPCPKGAIEQVLGYAEALSNEKQKPVRAYLIASEFSDRMRAAAKRTRDLELRTYEFSMQFHALS
jgi:hypothetical protein